MAAQAPAHSAAHAALAASRAHPAAPRCTPLQAFLAAHPLGEAHPQMALWNGGVTQRQLAWLRSELAAAEKASERVIVASHHQVGSGACRPTHAAWNWRDIQDALLASPAFRVRRRRPCLVGARGRPPAIARRLPPTLRP